MRPCTMSRKRVWSWSILRTSLAGGSAVAPGVAAGEDRGDVVQHVGGRDLVVAEVTDQSALDDLDLLLRVLVDHGGDQAGQLDRVLLVLEQLQLERAVQALVGLVVERPALD